MLTLDFYCNQNRNVTISIFWFIVARSSFFILIILGKHFLDSLWNLHSFNLFHLICTLLFDHYLVSLIQSVSQAQLSLVLLRIMLRSDQTCFCNKNAKTPSSWTQINLEVRRCTTLGPQEHAERPRGRVWEGRTSGLLPVFITAI